MATADVQQPPAEPAPALPDYVTSPNAVLQDGEANWRYGRAPDYSKTRKVFAETKQMNHTAASLPDLVENLVKNWEIEASFKTSLKDWRTIDHANYSFAINGGPPQDGEHMLKVGTYNAIIAPNEYYSPVNSDFASSHKTFKRMMPTFAWEVLEVYSGPPTVAFRWRHWGVMKNDYVGFNDKGEKVTAKAHGGPIDVQGVTVATVNDKLQLQGVQTWFDPIEMFRQIAPQGVVNKAAVPMRADRIENPSELMDSPSGSPALGALKSPKSATPGSPARGPTLDTGAAPASSSVSGFKSPMSPQAMQQAQEWSEVSETAQPEVDKLLSQSADKVHPHPHDMEQAVQPQPGEAVVAAADSEEVRQTHEEMSHLNLGPGGACPFMNRE